MDMKDILNRDASFRALLLSRLKSDCQYYLGNGNRNPENLWAGNEVDHIACMKALWNSFPAGEKPEWLTQGELLDLEAQVGIKAILVELDYKGYYNRFALTPEEFEKEYPKTFKQFGPIEEGNSDTLRPLVHIWFEPCVVGDMVWTRHFTDMEYGLPESDIESGNLASVCEDYMQSLKKYLSEDFRALSEKVIIPEAELQELANSGEVTFRQKAGTDMQPLDVQIRFAKKQILDGSSASRSDGQVVEER